MIVAVRSRLNLRNFFPLATFATFYEKVAVAEVAVAVKPLIDRIPDLTSNS